MHADVNGITVYDLTDLVPGTGLQDLLNPAQAATSAVVAALVARLAALENPNIVVPDPDAFAAGWSEFTAGGWTGGLVVREVGKHSYFSGAVQKNAAWAANELVLTLTGGHRPVSMAQGFAQLGSSVVPLSLSATGELRVVAANAAAGALSFGFDFWRP